MKEAFPDSCDWRGFAARTHYVHAAAPFDESSRPHRSPCSRLQSCTFAPSHRALGLLAALGAAELDGAHFAVEATKPAREPPAS